jgi:hypothetical protein
MPATLATITPYLKEVYEGRIREQLNNDVKTLKRIERSSSGVTNEVGGKYVTFPVHTRRNAGIGARPEMGALPAPGQQGTAAARIGLKYQYGGVQLTGQAISLADTDSKAFAKAVDVEMDGLKKDLQKDMNRQVYGDGNGTIGVITAVVTSTVIPVNDARLFQLGEVVDIATLPSTVVQTARTITSRDLTAGANTVTISGANITTVIGQVFVRTASLGNEITGFNSIIQSSGQLYNIDPVAEPEWAAVVNSNGGTPRALSEGLMIREADDIVARGGKTTVIFQSQGVRRAYFNLLVQQRQVVNEQEFKGGFKGLAFTTDDGEIPTVADVDAPLNTQYFVNEDSLTIYRDEEWHFLDRDGNMWKQVRDANGVYDAWFAHMVEYHELGCDQRNSNGRINDLIEA